MFMSYTETLSLKTLCSLTDQIQLSKLLILDAQLSTNLVHTCKIKSEHLITYPEN